MSTLGKVLTGIVVVLWLTVIGLLLVGIWFATGDTFDKVNYTAMVAFAVSVLLTGCVVTIEAAP